MPLIKHLAVIGVGLIGGSLARALKEAGEVEYVTGSGRAVPNLEKAVELGVIDSYCTNPLEAVKRADVVFIATPVCSIVNIVEAISTSLPKGCIVTDGGSVKQEIVDKCDKLLKGKGRFVGGHPIAGTEHSGVEASFSTLYHGKRCIITPLSATDSDAVSIVRKMWESAGSEVFEMTPETHDSVVAAISHLPHMAAYSLVNAVGAYHKCGENILKYSAGGFRDFTRIASSDPVMWRDISIQNKNAILEMMDSFSCKFSELRNLVASGDAHGVEAFFRLSKTLRDSLILNNGKLQDSE